MPVIANTSANQSDSEHDSGSDTGSDTETELESCRTLTPSIPIGLYLFQTLDLEELKAFLTITKDSKPINNLLNGPDDNTRDLKLNIDLMTVQSEYITELSTTEETDLTSDINNAEQGLLVFKNEIFCTYDQAVNLHGLISRDDEELANKLNIPNRYGSAIASPCSRESISSPAQFPPSPTQLTRKTLGDATQPAALRPEGLKGLFALDIQSQSSPYGVASPFRGTTDQGPRSVTPVGGLFAMEMEFE